MIKNIVFDVGNVLVHFRWRELMIDLGTSEETADFLGKNMVLTEFWDRLDLGVEDEDKACEHFTELFPQYKKDIEMFWKNIPDVVRTFDHTLPLIKTLKAAGYKVYLLSNYPPKLSDLHWPGFTFRNLTDGEVISGKEKIAKPDPAIFRLLCERYGLEPSECLFIDDRKKNTDAAELVGMKGLVLDGREGIDSGIILKEAKKY